MERRCSTSPRTIIRARTRILGPSTSSYPVLGDTTEHESASLHSVLPARRSTTRRGRPRSFFFLSNMLYSAISDITECEARTSVVRLGDITEYIYLRRREPDLFHHQVNRTSFIFHRVNSTLLIRDRRLNGDWGASLGARLSGVMDRS